MRRKIRTLLLWLFAVFVFAVAYAMSTKQSPLVTRSKEELIYDLEHDLVRQITMDNNRLEYQRVGDSHRYLTYAKLDDRLMEKLTEAGVDVKNSADPSLIQTVLVNILPLVIFISLFLFFIRRIGKGGTSSIFELRKSNAQILPDQRRITFDEVGGYTEQKELLQDVCLYLKDPKRWDRAMVRAPRGLLFEGPPGSGKTYMARALAGEAKVKFFFVSASEFVELFVGVGAARVRHTFEEAAKVAPAIVFIDELDAVGRRRGSGLGSGNDEHEQTVNQLLSCLDGCATYKGVVVVAATNRPDILDPALLRPGRFDRQLHFGQLSQADRVAILQVHLKNRRLGSDVDLPVLEEKIRYLTAAEIEGLVNEASLAAIRSCSGSQEVTIDWGHFDRAWTILTKSRRGVSGLESVLLESATQFSRARGQTPTQILLSDGQQLVGNLLWADSKFVRIDLENTSDALIVNKNEIKFLKLLDRAVVVSTDELRLDPGGQRIPSTT